MIIDPTTKRPIPVASNLAAVLKRIKAGDRQEEQAICGNVAIMLHCSAAMDLLRRKMGQWADTKNKESPSYRRRSATFPIHNLARDMNNGTIWKNKERLMLLDWLIDQLTMTPVAMMLECLYGVHPVEPDELLMADGREFAICSQAHMLLDIMPERKNWPKECAEQVRWHECVRVSQNILEKAIAAWPDREGTIEFPIEQTREAFTKAYASNSLWDDERRWQLWHFMVRYLEERV